MLAQVGQSAGALTQEGTFTIFAPTNEALSDLGDLTAYKTQVLASRSLPCSVFQRSDTHTTSGGSFFLALCSSR